MKAFAVVSAEVAVVALSATTEVAREAEEMGRIQASVRRPLSAAVVE